MSPESPVMGNLAPFTATLARVLRYLASGKLQFNPEGILDLNPAPFRHAAQAAGACTTLAYAALLLQDTCWSPEDLAARHLLATALLEWCQRRLQENINAAPRS